MARSLEELRKRYNSTSHGMSLRGGGPGRGPGPRGKGKPKEMGKTVKRLLSYVGDHKGKLVLVFLCNSKRRQTKILHSEFFNLNSEFLILNSEFHSSLPHFAVRISFTSA